jgi:uncharacterized protein YciI
MTVPPIRRELHVAADPAAAFEVFTAGIGRWWPVASHSVHGAGGTVAFEDGQLVEHGPDGARALWGTVTRWDPPAAVAFTWHPGYSAERASAVEVTFAPSGEQTLVTLTHSGWEAFTDPAAARAEYDRGWPAVLSAFQATADSATADSATADSATADSPDTDAATWAMLLHQPGPAAPADGAVMQAPLFREHVAFLERMRAAGYLVAAGPLTDVPGQGMTILRLPGADRMAEATRLATEDDQSVARGFFTVTVRPWEVVLAGATS